MLNTSVPALDFCTTICINLAYFDPSRIYILYRAVMPLVAHDIKDRRLNRYKEWGGAPVKEMSLSIIIKHGRARLPPNTLYPRCPY